MNKLTILIPILLIAANANGAVSKANDYADMHKQLNIMSDIIKSSVSDKSQAEHSKINSIQSTYLRGQGVVFTISSASNSRQWGNYNFNFVMPEMPAFPVAPIASVDGVEFAESIDIDIDETISHAFESAANGYERAMGILQQDREKTRELREKQRELAHELRDISREKRDLNYQLQRANKERQQALNKELAELSKQEEKLAKTKENLAQENKKVLVEQKAKQAEREKQRSRYFKNLTVALADTLCLYGNGLKALPKEENISVILKASGEKTGKRYKDNIIVFSKKDISACSAEKINVAALLKKSEQYQF